MTWIDRRRVIEYPVLELWSKGGPLDQWYADVGGPVGILRQWAPNVRGRAVDGGHFFPERNPSDTIAALREFSEGVAFVIRWASMLLRHEGFRRLCRARELLQGLDDLAPTIEDLAREVRISPFHFIRQFEAVFGVTPHQYRIQVRLDRAKELLASGQLSVTDVCMAVGFSSLGSFSTLFTRRFGETPSAYRRRVRAADLGLGCLSLMGHLPRRSFREA
jgi:AraC-like DNA-binding protein